MNIEKMRYNLLKTAIRELALNLATSFPHSPVSGFIRTFDEVINEGDAEIAKLQLSGERAVANTFRNIPYLHNEFRPYDLFSYACCQGERHKGTKDGDVWNYYLKTVFNRISDEAKAKLPYIDTTKELGDQTFGIYKKRSSYARDQADYYEP